MFKPCINSAGFFYLVKVLLKFYIIVFYIKNIYTFVLNKQTKTNIMITLKVTRHKGTQVEEIFFEFTAKTKKEVNAEFVRTKGWMYKDKNRTYEYIKN